MNLALGCMPGGRIGGLTEAVQDLDVRAGQVDWDEPASEEHRAINIGRQRYEEVVIFFLSEPGQAPQP